MYNFFVIPGARLSRTPSLSGTLDASLRPGGGVWGCLGSKLWWGGAGIWTPDLLLESQECNHYALVAAPKMFNFLFNLEHTLLLLLLPLSFNFSRVFSMLASLFSLSLKCIKIWGFYSQGEFRPWNLRISKVFYLKKLSFFPKMSKMGREIG